MSDEVEAVELDEPYCKGLSNVWAWCLAMVPLMYSALVGIVVVAAPDLEKIAIKSIRFGCIPFYLLFYMLDSAEVKRNGLEIGWGWMFWGILLCGFLLCPIYLFSRARKTGKYGYAIASLVALAVGVLLIAEVSGAPKIAKTEDSAPALLDSTVIAQNAVPTQQNNTGVGETKKEYDPRLILPKGQVWFYNKPPTCDYCSNSSLSFYVDGTCIEIEHKATPDTIKGTWYTKNGRLFRQDRNGNYSHIYVIDKDTLNYEGNGNYYKSKR